MSDAAASRNAIVAMLLTVVGGLPGGCSRDGGRHLALPSPSPIASVEATSTPSAEAGGAFARSLVVLENPSTSEDDKIEAIEAIAVDQGDDATALLLRFVDSTSVLVSAASIKGLMNRGCDRVEPVLVHLLDDNEWPRRAWAAKVLGVNGCRGAQRALGDRLDRERDGRVQGGLEEAMHRLEEVSR